MPKTLLDRRFHLSLDQNQVNTAQRNNRTRRQRYSSSIYLDTICPASRALHAVALRHTLADLSSVVSAPGDTIADLLDERNWSQAEFPSRLGYTSKHVSLLINGKASITEETAVKLERDLGGKDTVAERYVFPQARWVRVELRQPKRGSAARVSEARRAGHSGR
jgi:plasmid maintenance system antidote protein VapI